MLTNEHAVQNNDNFESILTAETDIIITDLLKNNGINTTITPTQLKQLSLVVNFPLDV